MPKYEISLSDTITYSRTKTVVVEADDEDEAQEKALALTVNSPAEFFDDFDEDQIDNTPWEADVERVLT